MRNINPDPFGNDEEFKAYLRQGRRKRIFVVIALVILVAIMIFL